VNSNEIYVLDCLVTKYGGSYTKGEDPPDSYLVLDRKKIAVEVTRLVQQVPDERGRMVPRISQDQPPFDLAKSVQDEVGGDLPINCNVLLVLSAPIHQARKTKRELVEVVRSCLREEREIEKISLFGNEIEIEINYNATMSERVRCIVSNKFSTANIGENAIQILSDRVIEKEKKCDFSIACEEYWLALYNDYWLASLKSYQYAYRQLRLDHSFDKILLIDGYGRVDELFRA
jgi:hypothetical protein